jgi:hypothetical protein
MLKSQLFRSEKSDFNAISGVSLKESADLPGVQKMIPNLADLLSIPLP